MGYGKTISSYSFQCPVVNTFTDTNRPSVHIIQSMRLSIKCVIPFLITKHIVIHPDKIPHYFKQFDYRKKWTFDF